MGLAVCCRGAVIEGENGCAFSCLDALAEDVIVLPMLFNLYFSFNEVHVIGYLVVHFNSSLKMIYLSKCVSLVACSFFLCVFLIPLKFLSFVLFCALSSVCFMMVRFFRFFTDCQYKKTLSSLQDERVRGTT